MLMSEVDPKATRFILSRTTVCSLSVFHMIRAGCVSWLTAVDVFSGSKLQSTTCWNLNKKTQKHDSYFRINVAWGCNYLVLKAQQRASIWKWWLKLCSTVPLSTIAPEMFSECMMRLSRLSDLFKQCCNTVEIIKWRTNRADVDLHDSVYLWRVCGQTRGNNQSHFSSFFSVTAGKCNDTLPSTAHFFLFSFRLVAPLFMFPPNKRWSAEV